ncbi:hypothetical protein U1Q18_030015 [Sarracenia purpurea var. burkii]
MGCGKSKHDVATGNTIKKPNSKAVAETVPDNVKNADSGDGSSAKQQQKEGEEKSKDGASEEAKQRGGEKSMEEFPRGGGDGGVEGGGDETKSGDAAKGGEKEEAEGEKKSAGDGVEAIISDGMSGNTEYYSPKNKVGVDEDGDQKSTDEKATETTNGELVKENEGKETEVVPTVEQASATTTSTIVATGQEETRELMKGNEENETDVVPTVEPENSATTTIVTGKEETEELVKGNEERETKLVPTVEPEDSATATVAAIIEQEKTSSANQEGESGSSAEDPKTN